MLYNICFDKMCNNPNLVLFIWPCRGHSLLRRLTRQGHPKSNSKTMWIINACWIFLPSDFDLNDGPDTLRTENSQVLWLTFLARIKRPWRFPAIFLWSVFSQRTGKAALFPTHSQRFDINAVVQCSTQSSSCTVIVRVSESPCCNITLN